MQINEIAGRRVKLSDNSITIKSDDGKTAGVVRGVERFLKAPANKQVDFSRALRASGIFGSKDRLINSVYISGKNVFYLDNEKFYSSYEKYYSSDQAFYKAETEKYNARKEIVEKARAAGVIVIPVIFD